MPLLASLAVLAMPADKIDAYRETAKELVD